MKQNNSNIEDLFRSSFNEYKVEPSAEVWNKVNTKLNIKQFFSGDFKHFNVYYLSAILGIITIIGVLLSDISGSGAQMSKSINQNTDKETYTYKTSTDEVKPNHEYITQGKTKVVVENKQTKKYRKTKVETSRVSEVIPFTQNHELKSLNDLKEDTSAKLNLIKAQVPRPLFKLANKEGCAPFEIKLQNYSQLAQNYEWTFGDGTKSTDVSPSHTYQYPGVYAVKLKAIGPGGLAYSVFDSIVVHENIVNKITKSFDGELIENEQFSIRVKTNQKAEYEWDFGDGYYSDNENVTHKYEKQGNYTITLKTWTNNNCYDSVKVADVLVVESGNKIRFPNAFIPNPGGPSSGKYYNREFYNDIFHPVIKGTVAEYTLKIYSRTGAIIFETHDINIGWDGYYQNMLMPEGVYPFVSSGKFEGGEKFFRKGDITIIHRQ